LDRRVDQFVVAGQRGLDEPGPLVGEHLDPAGLDGVVAIAAASGYSSSDLLYVQVLLGDIGNARRHALDLGPRARAGLGYGRRRDRLDRAGCRSTDRRNR
jgi:hypothetical protein